MRKKTLFLAILIISIIINIIAMPNVYAEDSEGSGGSGGSGSSFWSEIQGQADSFVGQGKNGSTADLSSFGNAAVGVGQVLTTIGLAVVMVGYLILGIKYMMASPEEAGKIKGQLVGLTVSAIVIFGAYGIWNAVVGFFNGLG